MVIYKLSMASWLLIFSSMALLLLSCQQAQSARSDIGIPVDSIPVEIVDTITQEENPLPMDSLNMDVDYLMGKFDPSKHPDFIEIDIRHADQQGRWLRRDVYEAFIRMYEHALRDSIRLQIRSATRNFYAQKKIWEDKWTGVRKVESGENLAETTPDPKERALKILRYSSMPGSSRHHWGTDIDLNSFENSWFEEGEGLDIYNWLTAHAHTYGFCQPYTAGRPYGYFEERWHWSYMPVSVPMTEFARQHLKNEMISGFEGSETATQIDIVNRYVLGIGENCLEGAGQ